MLKICTVYFEGKYSPDYVSKFYNSIKRNTSIPFQSVCISDTDVEADIVLPFNHFSDIRYHWHKLKFFSPMFAYQNPGDDIIIMDIDQIITGNVDDIIGAKVKENELLTYSDWWTEDGKYQINGGFYKFKSGSLQHIWNKFQLNPDYWQLYYYNKGIVHKKYYGEQKYVEYCMSEKKKYSIKKLPGKILAPYYNDFKKNLNVQKKFCKKFNTDFMIMGDVHKYLKIIHFCGTENMIHNSSENFVKENWHG